MRPTRWGILALCLVCGSVWAGILKEGEDKYYVESEKDKPWEEVAVPVPKYPDNTAQWLDLYVSPTYVGNAKLMLNSIEIAPDKTVHYILNTQSSNGANNLSAEALLCTERSVKTLAYGDDVNHRWITPRKSQWRNIGNSLNQLDAVRGGVLYKTFCEDGLPRDNKELQDRIRTRAVLR